MHIILIFVWCTNYSLYIYGLITLDSMTYRVVETLKKHNFGNIGSLLKVAINRWLINDLMARWDPIDQVLRFGTIELCPTIEEYSRI